jgi:hypothetical protein
MADSPQYPLQNMENQSRFDLTSAIRGWKQDCAGQPGMSMDDVRELEGHFRECVADFQGQGLSDEQAFRAALRKVGSPRELAREFARENPMAVWRERFFWMAFAGFAISVWGLMSNELLLWLTTRLARLVQVPPMSVFALCGYLPVLTVAILIATGSLPKLARSVDRCLQSRSRLALTAVASLSLALLAFLCWTFFGPTASPLTKAPARSLVLLLYLLSWPLILLALLMILCKPHPLGESASPPSTMNIAAPAVWRERVFWMAVGGLLVGFWRSVSQFSLAALFYTGDLQRPYASPLLVAGLQKVILVLPVIIISILIARKRRGQSALSAEMPTSLARRFAPVIAVMVAWIVVELTAKYFWQARIVPAEHRITDLSALLLNYLSTMQWVRPAFLAALILWLGSARAEALEDSQASVL